MKSRSALARLLPLSPLVAIALVASGCGGSSGSAGSSSSGTPSGSGSPSPSMSLPAGVSLTTAGSMLDFGDAATVAFTANAQKSTALELTVTALAKGRIGDFSAYRLDKDTKTSTPYYATVKVSNVGTGDVGRTAIPLWGLSSRNTLIGASGFTNSFAKCPSRALPQSFAAGADLTTCLVYLVPKGGTLQGISYRPVQSDEPIVWKGTITAPAPAPAKNAKNVKKNTTKG